MNKIDISEIILDNSEELVAIVFTSELFTLISLSYLLLKIWLVTSEEKRKNAFRKRSPKGLHPYCHHFISLGG